MKDNILITGGAGFVGSNLAIYLKSRLKYFNIICLDNLIRRGSVLNVSRLKSTGIKFIKGDVRNKQQIMHLPQIKILIEASAEPSVLASYEKPSYTIDTNLIGAINCLELAKRDNAGVIFLSTSRVYPIELLNGLSFKETDTRFDWEKGLKSQGVTYQGVNIEFPLLGSRSLYGATKLSAENIITEYADMFGLNAIINRLGVIAGPWQMGKVDQGIVGYWVARHKFQADLNYIGFDGTGKQVRDVIHVDDICHLIYKEIIHLNEWSGNVFNAGGGRDNAVSLLELTNIVQKKTKVRLNIGSIPETRKGDIRIYITDNKRIIKVTGWQPTKSVEETVFDVNKWISKYRSKLKTILN